MPRDVCEISGCHELSPGSGAASQTASFAWSKNSNLTTYTDPKSEDTAYGYDALQRLTSVTSVTDALSGVAGILGTEFWGHNT